MANGVLSAGIGGGFREAGATLEPIANALLADQLKTEKLQKLGNAILDAQQALNNPEFIAKLKAEGFTDEEIERLRADPKRLADLAAGSFSEGAIEQGNIRPSSDNAIIQEGIDAGKQNQPAQATALGLPDVPRPDAVPSPLLADRAAPEEVTLDKVAPGITIRGTRAETLGPLEKRVTQIKKALAGSTFRQLERGIIQSGGTAADVNDVRERILSPAQEALTSAQAVFKEERKFGLEKRNLSVLEKRAETGAKKLNILARQTAISEKDLNRKSIRDAFDAAIKLGQLKISAAKKSGASNVDRQLKTMGSLMVGVAGILDKAPTGFIRTLNLETNKIEKTPISAAVANVGSLAADRAQDLLNQLNEGTVIKDREAALQESLSINLNTMSNFKATLEAFGVKDAAAQNALSKIGVVMNAAQDQGITPPPKPAAPTQPSPTGQRSIGEPEDIRAGRISAEQFEEGQRIFEKDVKTGGVTSVFEVRKFKGRLRPGAPTKFFVEIDPTTGKETPIL